LKVLLTGASGFVGSHILDQLVARGFPTRVLLRPNSSRRFIRERLPNVETTQGEFADMVSLSNALAGATHVIHCAGAVKACRASDFFQANQVATRNLVQAFNKTPHAERFILISSLAAAGPALPLAPAREGQPENPVSVYGKSKLAAETELSQACKAPYVIMRPPAVYGPRDSEFLRLFVALKRHIRPIPSHQPLSLVFVRDLARVALDLLSSPLKGKLYYIANREVVTAREIAATIAQAMKQWTIPLPLPVYALWPICLAQHALSVATGKPNVLSLQKFNELSAPGWVCDPALLERDHGLRCPTNLRQGVSETLEWYQQNRWL
jgi:nucleoside-diphosphate-sugar epimerase